MNHLARQSRSGRARSSVLGVVGGLSLLLALVAAPVTGATTRVDAALHSAGPSSSEPAPTVAAMRAAHHPGYDRFVFEFNGNTIPPVEVGIGPAFAPMPGRAVITVNFYPIVVPDPIQAKASTDRALALPNMLALRFLDWWEGEVWYGIGLAKRMPYHVHRLKNPARLVIDVSTAFKWTTRKVFFQNATNYRRGIRPYLKAVSRPVPAAYPATGLLDRIFAGPTRAEKAAGLRFVSSTATGFRSVSVRNQVARLRLTGGCASGGSTFTIANEIIPTLRALPTVRWVKIYDPAGHTRRPTGRSDSIPTCLTP